MGNDAVCKVKGRGTIQIRTHNGVTRTLTNVRHVPDLKRNLISLGTLESLGCRYTAEGGEIKISKGALTLMKGKRRGNLYFLLASTVTEKGFTAQAISAAEKGLTKLWHMRLGHMSEKGMEILNKKGSLGDQTLEKLEFCEHCILGKQRKVSFSKGKHTTEGILGYLHSDLWGPSRVPSLGGKRYMMTIIDDYSRKVWVYFLKQKNEALSRFKEFKTLVENQTGQKIKRLRTDNGLEFCNSEFDKFCSENGIGRHKTLPGTPQQNGVAERLNRTILERTRCMLSNAGLWDKKEFWAEAASTACYLINRSPHSALNHKIPEEIWSGRSVDYSNLRVFGCTAFAHMNEGTLSPRSSKCMFLGYASESKGYKLWCIETKKVILSRNVIFNELELIHHAQGTASITPCADSEKVQKDTVQVEISAKPPSPNQTPNLDPLSRATEPVPTREEEAAVPERYSVARDRVRREVRRPIRFIDEQGITAYALLAAQEINNEDEPSSYRDAISGPDSDKWVAAMEEEMESLYKNETWVLCEKPKDRKVLGCKWVFKRKQGIPGIEQPRWKARLVVKGFHQKEGIDFNEIFSPVVRHTSIRFILGLVAQQNLELEQMDVKTAFLNGELEEDIFMTQPEGFEAQGREECVCKLRKSLYGLKQAPRQWYKRFDSFMLNQNFHRSNFDSYVYFKRAANGVHIYLLLYVDDMLIASSNKTLIADLKKVLSSEFEMKDLGPAKRILGMEIHRDRVCGKLYLSQQAYIKRVLEKFSMKDSKPVTTPLAAHFQLSSELCPKTEAEVEEMAKIPYQSAVGSLMYAMVCSRPDLAYAVSVVSRYMHNPGKQHWNAVKWILRYLKGTSSLGLVFAKSKNGLKVTGFVDSDYAGDRDKRKSISGFIFLFASSAISWKSNLQSVVALSTTKAEYVSATEGVKEAIWLKGLATELGVMQDSVAVYSDNQSAIHLTKNDTFHSKTKHISVRFHYIRDTVSSGEVSVLKIHTSENPADMLTKPLPIAKFLLCVDLVGVSGCNS